jgi:hypothetical protein
LIIRYLTPEDLPRLKELHEKSGVPCQFPDVQNEFYPIPVVVDENNRVVAAVGAMPAAEIYFFLDRKWETPGMRLEALRRIHEVVRQDLQSRGVVEVHAFIPPKIAKFFGKRLVKLFGWIKCDWPYFSRRTDYV